MNGALDQVCDLAVTRDFVSRTHNAALIELPKVGHGYSGRQELVAAVPYGLPDARPGPACRAAAAARHARGSAAGRGAGHGRERHVCGTAVRRRRLGRARQGRRQPRSAAAAFPWSGSIRFATSGKRARPPRSRRISIACCATTLTIGTRRTPCSSATRRAPTCCRSPSTGCRSIARAGRTHGDDGARRQRVIPVPFHELARRRLRRAADNARGRSPRCRQTRCASTARARADSLCPKVPPGHVQALALPGGHHFGGGYDALALRIVAGLKAILDVQYHEGNVITTPSSVRSATPWKPALT